MTMLRRLGGLAAAELEFMIHQSGSKKHQKTQVCRGETNMGNNGNPKSPEKIETTWNKLTRSEQSRSYCDYTYPYKDYTTCIDDPFIEELYSLKNQINQMCNCQARSKGGDEPIKDGDVVYDPMAFYNLIGD